MVVKDIEQEELKPSKPTRGKRTPKESKESAAPAPEARLLVVNMAKNLPDIRLRIYVCPSEENGFHGSHLHAPAKYIACYVQAGAKYVGEVGACVRINKTGPAEVLWKFGEESDSEYIKRAQAALKETLTLNRIPPRLIFLIDNLSATDFVHDTGNSLLASRVYFDITEMGVTDVKDLAVKLKSAIWSALPRWKPE